LAYLVQGGKWRVAAKTAMVDVAAQRDRQRCFGSPASIVDIHSRFRGTALPEDFIENSKSHAFADDGLSSDGGAGSDAGGGV
jgi:hypothetical protein